MAPKEKIDLDLDGWPKLQRMQEGSYKLFMRHLKTRYGPNKEYKIVRYRGVYKWTYARIAKELRIKNSGELSQLYKRARGILKEHSQDEYDSDMDYDSESYVEENVLDSEDELHLAG